MSEPAHEPTVPSGYGTVTPWIISPDSAALIRKALAAGASSVTRVSELFWGDRVGRVRDPFGNIWWRQSRATDVSEPELQARMQDPAMLEAMRYVQQSLIDALRNQHSPGRT